MAKKTDASKIMASAKPGRKEEEMKSGFVLLIKFPDVEEPIKVFNCCGLGQATIEQAKTDGLRILRAKQRYISRHFPGSDTVPRTIREHWEGAKPHSLIYTEFDDRGILKGYGKVIL